LPKNVLLGDAAASQQLLWYWTVIKYKAQSTIESFCQQLVKAHFSPSKIGLRKHIWDWSGQYDIVLDTWQIQKRKSLSNTAKLFKSIQRKA